jgi:hypothetical protein
VELHGGKKMVKNEAFIITQGNLYRDPWVEEMQLHYNRQYMNLIFMLAGAVCIVVSLL